MDGNCTDAYFVKPTEVELNINLSTNSFAHEDYEQDYVYDTVKRIKKLIAKIKKWDIGERPQKIKIFWNA